MLNAVLNRADLSQFVSLRTTVSSFYSASRRWLHHLPFPEKRISHSQEAERQGSDKIELGIFEIGSFRWHRKENKKAQLKTPCSKSCPSDVYKEENTGKNIIHLRSCIAHWDSVVKQNTQCQSAQSTTTTVTDSCEKAAFHWQWCADAAFMLFFKMRKEEIL